MDNSRYARESMRKLLSIKLRVVFFFLVDWRTSGYQSKIKIFKEALILRFCDFVG